MLTFKAHSNLKETASGKCNRIVVYNTNGDPVSFVIQVGADKYLAASIGDKNFKGLLEAFNIDKLEINDV